MVQQVHIYMLSQIVGLVGIALTMLAHFEFVIASEKAYFVTPFTQLGLAVEGTSSYSFMQNFG